MSNTFADSLKDVEIRKRQKEYFIQEERKFLNELRNSVKNIAKSKTLFDKKKCVVGLYVKCILDLYEDGEQQYYSIKENYDDCQVVTVGIDKKYAISLCDKIKNVICNLGFKNVKCIPKEYMIKKVVEKNGLLKKKKIEVDDHIEYAIYIEFSWE